MGKLRRRWLWSIIEKSTQMKVTRSTTSFIFSQAAALNTSLLLVSNPFSEFPINIFMNISKLRLFFLSLFFIIKALIWRCYLQVFLIADSLFLVSHGISYFYVWFLIGWRLTWTRILLEYGVNHNGFLLRESRLSTLHFS